MQHPNAQRAAPAAVRLEAAPHSPQQLQDPPADAAPAVEQAGGDPANGIDPADRTCPPPAASIAESSRPSIDIGSLLSGSLGSTLGSSCSHELPSG